MRVYTALLTEDLPLVAAVGLNAASMPENPTRATFCIKTLLPEMLHKIKEKGSLNWDDLVILECEIPRADLVRAKRGVWWTAKHVMPAAILAWHLDSTGFAPVSAKLQLQPRS